MERRGQGFLILDIAAAGALTFVGWAVVLPLIRRFAPLSPARGAQDEHDGGEGGARISFRDWRCPELAGRKTSMNTAKVERG